MILVTGASGQLGRLVIEELLQRVDASEIIAAARDVKKIEDLGQRGVQLRTLDYADASGIPAALEGVTRLLLISSSEVGQRLAQHKNVIEAAAKTGLELLAYTSILHADTTPLPLGNEHKATEALIKVSGIPYTLLRNGWYTENYTLAAGMAVAHGAVIGCAGEGKIASAARADYAKAAAVVLTSPVQSGAVYELAGDEAYTLSELAATISEVSGKAVAYVNMSEAEYEQALLGAGLPDFVAKLLSESDTGASKGGLFDESKTLSRLIGEATTPLKACVKAALQG